MQSLFQTVQPRTGIRLVNNVLESTRKWSCPNLTLNPLTWRIWWAPNSASKWQMGFNSAFKGLNAELNPICHLLALLGTHHILHVSRIRVKIPSLSALIGTAVRHKIPHNIPTPGRDLKPATFKYTAGVSPSRSLESRNSGSLTNISFSALLSVCILQLCSTFHSVDSN